MSRFQIKKRLTLGPDFSLPGAQQAPDFWHWRSGTFEFTAERESVERRIRIYELLLEQYQTLGIDNPAAIEEITSQLSRLKSAAT